MYKGKKVVCIIPARAGSKGLPGKNIKKLNGKPLIVHSIEQARRSKYIDRVIVSTNDTKAAKISKKAGAEVPFMRPAYLSGDKAGTLEVLLHALSYLEANEGFSFDIVVLLHVTAPLRKPEDIDNCIRLLVERGRDNVFSVSEAHRNPYFNMVEVKKGRVSLVKRGNFVSRQSAPKVYDLNSSIYAWKTNALKRKKGLFLDKTAVYVMPKSRSIDIDDSLDFEIAKIFLRLKK